MLDRQHAEHTVTSNTMIRKYIPSLLYPPVSCNISTQVIVDAYLVQSDAYPPLEISRKCRGFSRGTL